MGGAPMGIAPVCAFLAMARFLLRWRAGMYTDIQKHLRATHAAPYSRCHGAALSWASAVCGV